METPINRYNNCTKEKIVVSAPFSGGLRLFCCHFCVCLSVAFARMVKCSKVFITWLQQQQPAYSTFLLLSQQTVAVQGYEGKSIPTLNLNGAQQTREFYIKVQE